MEYVNPKKDPNEWLAATCKALLDDVTKESCEAVAEIIDVLIDYTEPGLIDQAFAPLIEQYMGLLEEYEKMNNNFDPTCLPVNQQEEQDGSNIDFE